MVLIYMNINLPRLNVSKAVQEANPKIAELLVIIDKQKHSISQLQEELQKEERKQTFDISDIQHDKIPNFLTGFKNSSW